MKNEKRKEIDLFEFLKNYPYVKCFKQQIYFLLHPIAHIKELARVFKEKDYSDPCLEEDKKENK